MREHTSVNALVGEFLTRYTNVRQRRLKALDMLDGLAQRNAASSSGDWSRESLHER